MYISMGETSVHQTSTNFGWFQGESSAGIGTLKKNKQHYQGSRCFGHLLAITMYVHVDGVL
jgi:hypothetical protein